VYLISTSVLNVFGPFFLFTRVRDCTYTRLWVHDCICLMWATVHVHAGVRDYTYLCARLYLYSLVYATVLIRVHGCTCLVCVILPVLVRVCDYTHVIHVPVLVD
jgi:hypothetical protein